MKLPEPHQQAPTLSIGGISFRDPDLPSLAGILPIAVQNLEEGNGSEQLRQSVLKANYLMEKLRYLNSIAVH